VRAIVDGLRDCHVPVIYFVNGGPHLLEAAATAGSDVLGVCWRTPIDLVAARVGGRVALQGNLDPHALFAEPGDVRRRAAGVLARMAGRPGHIMNLGHGILPDTPIASVEALVEAVHASQSAGSTAEVAPVCTT
jgi:uroporphyrinogen decarboxylase